MTAKIFRAFWLFNLGWLTPCLIAASAKANPVPEFTNNDSLEAVESYGDAELGQVTDVTQLRDVQPTDWAYEALRSLVERYGCIEGYPDQTYRGNRALTRYEFAAGLNSCLNAIEALIAASGGVTQEDLAQLQRLAQEFEAELATIGARVDNLEGRVAFLEENQFSTTTKLNGEVIIALGQIFQAEDVDGDEVDEVTVLGDRVRLEFNTSFTGEDLLFTRLSAGNFPAFADETGTFQGDLGFAQPENNDVGVEVLFYTFPVTDSTQIYVAATGGAMDDYTPTINFLDGDGATGAVSAFGTRNPIYFLPADAGLAVIQQFGEKLEFAAGYLANPANDPTEGNGLFNGPFSATAQLTFTPTDALSIGLTYVHSYNQSDTGTGTRLANFRFFSDEVLEPSLDRAIPTVSDSYGVEFSWAISERFVLGGWGGYTNVRTLSTLDGLINRGEQDIVNWAVTLALPDLGKQGSILGFVVGSEPFVVDTSFNVPNTSNSDGRDTDDLSLHVEGFYQYAVTDNLFITPGVVWITAPNGEEDNEDQIIGTIRTTFTF